MLLSSYEVVCSETACGSGGLLQTKTMDFYLYHGSILQYILNSREGNDHLYSSLYSYCDSLNESCYKTVMAISHCETAEKAWEHSENTTSLAPQIKDL